jgi:hypothetical protein
MTADQLREAIGLAEGLGISVGVLEMARPATPYNRERVELAPLVYGQQVGSCNGTILVLVDIAALRRILSLVDLAAAPPQGHV